MKSLKDKGLHEDYLQLLADSSAIEEVTAGRWYDSIGSMLLGNKGYLCTVTHECASFCRD